MPAKTGQFRRQNDHFSYPKKSIPEKIITPRDMAKDIAHGRVFKYKSPIPRRIDKILEYGPSYIEVLDRWFVDRKLNARIKALFKERANI